MDSAIQLLLGGLSEDMFERLTSNGSVFFAFLGIGLNQIFWAIQGYDNLDVLPWFRIRKWHSWVNDAIRRVLCEIGELVETFRFWDEYNHEYEILSILNNTEPASFWRENVIAVVIPPRVLARMSW